MKHGGGACYNWLRGVCSDEKCRYVHFPPLRSQHPLPQMPPYSPPSSST